MTPIDQAQHDERYRIVASRDRRWDGQFVTAVHSTRIYCRPSCPARTPRPSGVTFYATAAAAHLAGYRACKRCLPEATPGSPDWNHRDDIAARAMRLILDGAVERDGVDGLARALGYSPRQLNRVLTETLGAGPKALSRAHRAQTARSLLVSSSLSVTDVAFASGFGSVRQFTDTMRDVFAATPTAIRARAEVRRGPGGGLRVHLPARAPFDAGGVFAWLAARAIRGVERASGERYERVLTLPGGPGWFAATAAAPPAVGIDLEARLTTLADLPSLVARVRALFDLDADPIAVDAGLGGIPELAERVRATPGIRLPGTVDPHEIVLRALVGQQVSVAAARTALGRLVDELGRPAPDDIAEGFRLVPDAATIAAGGADNLRGPRARAATIVRVADAFATGSLRVDPATPLSSARAALLAIPGIGPWTADYILMRVRQHPDVFLPTDLGVQRGAQALGIPHAPRALSVWSERAAPWRSYLTMHLWRAAPSRPPRARPTE
ncbi:AlkA N-terminal domain-containing protein [Curtobacterium ammoniigenes]|uniref:AlkA N-terminal domain-containing protein n=1 Tax=Curtobacterium ammoniigenes TaxID=395387 RepID=UPI000B27235F|nr:AlkA N-terminal domain-containing protein [Curtobacterium ammoniigenes]